VRAHGGPLVSAEGMSNFAQTPLSERA
jgi:hypothetical protein